MTHDLPATPRTAAGGEHPEYGCTEGKSDSKPHDGKSSVVQGGNSPEVLEALVEAFLEGRIQSCGHN